jgi:hypothetical protein
VETGEDGSLGKEGDEGKTKQMDKESWARLVRTM